jgi:hypothetical protein
LEKRAEQVLPGNWGERGSAGKEVAQTMYTHVSKFKNDKILKRERSRCLKG